MPETTEKKPVRRRKTKVDQPVFHDDFGGENITKNLSDADKSVISNVLKTATTIHPIWCDVMQHMDGCNVTKVAEGEDYIDIITSNAATLHNRLIKNTNVKYWGVGIGFIRLKYSDVNRSEFV